MQAANCPFRKTICKLGCNNGHQDQNANHQFSNCHAPSPFVEVQEKQRCLPSSASICSQTENAAKVPEGRILRSWTEGKEGLCRRFREIGFPAAKATFQRVGGIPWISRKRMATDQFLLRAGQDSLRQPMHVRVRPCDQLSEMGRFCRVGLRHGSIQFEVLSTVSG